MSVPKTKSKRHFAKCLIDSSVIPNVMSAAFAWSLYLSLKPTDRSVIMLEGKRSNSLRRLVENFPVIFGDPTVPITFIVVASSPYDILVGLPEMESLLACLDLGKNVVSFVHVSKAVRLNYEHDTSHERRIVSDTDTADFTSGSVLPGPTSTDDDESGLVLSLRDNDEKAGIESAMNDNESEDDIEWEEPEDFNVMDDNVYSFAQYISDSCLNAEEF